MRTYIVCFDDGTWKSYQAEDYDLPDYVAIVETGEAILYIFKADSDIQE